MSGGPFPLEAGQASRGAHGVNSETLLGLAYGQIHGGGEKDLTMSERGRLDELERSRNRVHPASPETSARRKAQSKAR